MKKFLVRYHASTSAQDQMARTTPEQMKAGMDLWMQWSKAHRAEIVDLGQPLGRAGTWTGPAR